MEPEAMKYLAKALAAIAMMTVPIGTGMAAAAAFNAIGRNPKLENTLFSKVIAAIALIEVVALFAFIAIFII